MTIDQLIDVLYPPGQPRQLTLQQKAVLKHPQGPAWVLAGPGSGKTEVLTAMVLRLLYVDGDPVQPERVPPESIFVTTFTEKAARNLEDRISLYRVKLVAHDPTLGSVDVSRLRLGTLHGLCNDILQEFRSPNYQNVRLMDEFEQSMFAYERMSIIKASLPTDRSFWAHFDYLFQRQEWQKSYTNNPSKWNGTAALVKLFNRVAEGRASVPDMIAAGGEWARCGNLYQEYLQHLADDHRCDFSHLQVRFLDFLGTPVGTYFRDGGEDDTPGIRWVLVDEYQDTNLVQEEIYLTLANRSPFNVVVVGDDDQAMYRFRGGSVECMVTFDQACKAYLGGPPPAVQTYSLLDNFRSHPEIVDFCNEFISAFPSMALPGARVAGKTPLIPKSSISGKYPVTGVLSGRNLNDLAGRFAATVRGLVDNGIVNDPSECCLLLKSTRESPHNAAPYVNALLAEGLTPYNPRNKAFLNQEEVAGLLGAVLAVLDPQERSVPANPKEIVSIVQVFRDEYVRLSGLHSELKAYVDRCTARLAAKPGKFLDANLQEVVYYLLGLPPFDQWQNDPVRRVRLAKVTVLFESFASMPVPGKPHLSKGLLRSSVHNPGEVVDGWSRVFYHLFVGYLSRTGLDEEEDDEVICPPGMVPVMTIHQAKGLEFPFVFVGHATAKPQTSTSHRLESELGNFPSNPARAFTLLPEDVRAELDLVRQYFVAYSRAQYALVVLGTKSQLKSGGIPCGPTPSWLTSHTDLL